MWSIVLVAPALFVLAACNKSAPVTPGGSAQSVSFLNKGAVVPHPISTSVIVNQYFIKFSSTQNGNTIDSWSSVISAQDFSHLISIINDNNLMETSDPVLPQGVGGCIGHQGMTIVMTMDNNVDTLNISGLLWCDRSFWPAGLVSLVAFQDSLVEKYKPQKAFTRRGLACMGMIFISGQLQRLFCDQTSSSACQPLGLAFGGLYK
jgi:hypothetical protein